MAILIGIDEAGYGPLLGPLVVSAVTFTIPDSLLTSSLWDILRQSVSRRRMGSTGRIVINDSKRLHQKRGDVSLLQRGVLSCLNATHSLTPTTFAELLKHLGQENCHEYELYPWYTDTVRNWPLHFDPDDIDTAAAAFSQDMKDHGLQLVSIKSQSLLVGRFNDLITAINNKATVLFSQACAFIDQARRKFEKEDIQIVIDKQGGRNRYRQPLQKMFPDLQMKILKESDTISSYQLTDTHCSMKIHFLAKGDDRQLPIALASMASKYLREIFMDIINSYFQKHCPGIIPTAGYYQDGKRFLDDLQTYRISPSLAPEKLLVRQR